MDKIFNILTSDPRDRRLYGGDSLSDQMNSCHTVYIMTAFALIIQAQYMLGNPIKCWCDGHFEDSQVDYTNSVCWTQNTYYLPYDKEIPKEEAPRSHIGYYQWVPLILIAQAVLFYLPRPIWRMLSKKSGIAVSTITDAAIDYQKKSDSDARDKTIRYMVKHMGRFLFEISQKHTMDKTCKACWWHIYGNYLIIMYILTKLVYIGNAIGQMFLLNRFLDTNFHLYGFEIIQKMVKEEEWSNSERFPKITLCDFKIRTLGNVQPYTVQCSLPMNLFNEITFIFIWFWFAFVIIVSVGSLIVWLYVIIDFSHQVRYVKTRLVAMDRVNDRNRTIERGDVHKFISLYLRHDGCFIIRMVAKNSSDIIAAELVSGLWDYYLENKRRLKRMNSKFAQENSDDDDDDGLYELGQIN